MGGIHFGSDEKVEESDFMAVKEQSPVKNSAFMNDLLDMNFNAQSPDLVKEQSNNDDFLASTFAQFGIDLKQEAEEKTNEPEEPATFEITLPDFNTVDHKVKRILDSLPDYGYLFED